MGGINISGRIKQTFYPRTRHGELKVISMIYAPPYLIRRSVPKGKSIAARIVSDGNPKSTQDGKHWKASNGCTTITTEQHKIKKASHDTATRYGTIVENGY